VNNCIAPEFNEQLSSKVQIFFIEMQLILVFLTKKSGRIFINSV